MYFITSKIIFSKFGMYLTYKNRFWGHFSWFLGRDINSTVWTRNGSKIKNKVLVFKGLIAFCWGRFRVTAGGPAEDLFNPVYEGCFDRIVKLHR